MKVQITLDDALMERVDAYADANYMSRSGLISLSVSQYLNAHDMMSAINDIALCMRKIADNGTVDHETMEQLEDIERFMKMLSQNVK